MSSFSSTITPPLSVTVTLTQNGEIVTEQRLDLAGVNNGATSAETRPLLPNVSIGTTYTVKTDVRERDFDGEELGTSVTVDCAHLNEAETVIVDITSDGIRVGEDKCS